MPKDPDEPTYGGPPPSSSRKPSTREALITMLTGLMLLYPDQRLSPEEWKIRLRAYLEDLSPYPVPRVEQAIRAGRRTWKFFPSIPELLDEIGRVQQGVIGSGTMSGRDWPQYRAWLQFTNRLSPNLQPYPPKKLAELLATISDSEMSRLGTPRHGPA